MGFKLGKDTSFRPAKVVLRMRRSASGMACSNGLWESITASAVEISQLSFVITEVPLNISLKRADLKSPIEKSCNTIGESCLFVRAVKISLTGMLKDHKEVTQTLTETVHIRNNFYCELSSLSPRVCL